MEFDRLLVSVIEMLAREQRLAYRGLKRRFNLNDEDIEDLKAELIDARRVAHDDNGRVLVWGSAATSPAASVPAPADDTPAHLAERNGAGWSDDSTVAGERKTLTVLFADLKGSTALIDGLDPERARELLDPALRLMMEAVHYYEGYVAQALGDGILALFGAPLAHEDHAQRAVHAALRMQEAFAARAERVRQIQGAGFALRIGLNSGEVVVRSIRKDDLHADYVPVGQTMHIAARMEQMAAPGTILIAEHTARLVEGWFALEHLGLTELRGLEQPVGVYRVLGHGARRTRLQVAAARGLTHFVGRRFELAQLGRALDEARVGRGQVVTLMGEAGMGKSRLMHEFRAALGETVVFEAWTASHGRSSPYLPLVEMLKNYFAIQVQDDERTRREKIIGRLLALDRSFAQLLGPFFTLLNVPDTDGEAPTVDSQTRRRQTFAALKRLLLRASVDAPVVLMVEDLHWIDSESQGFLDALVDSLGSARVLLVASFRPEYRHSWGTKTYCTQLNLTPFAHAEAETLVDTLLGPTQGGADAPQIEVLRRWLLERGEGSPFFIEELHQELHERGTLGRDLDGRVILAGEAVGASDVPRTVQGVLAARIDRLASDEKELLQQLAVIGRSFPSGLAAAVVGHSEQALLPLLAALERKEFIVETSAFPDVTYSFKHALTQEVAYGSLLRAQRRALHERTARAIEQRYATEIEDHFATLAHHYRQGEDGDKAIHYLAAAGRQATRRAAHADALSLLKEALALFRSRHNGEGHEARELDILLDLIVPLHTCHGMTSHELEEVCQRARVLAGTTEHHEAAMRVLLELRVFHTMRGDNRLALDTAMACRELAVTLDQPRYWLLLHSALCIVHFMGGAFVECRRSATDADGCHVSDDFAWQHEYAGYDPMVLALAYDGMAATVMGERRQARQALERAIALGAPHAPYIRGLGVVVAAFAYSIARDYAACLKHAELGLAIAHENGYPDWHVISMLGRGLGLLGSDPVQGVELLAGSITAFRAVRCEIMMSALYGQLAEAEIGLGRLAQAREHLDLAGDFARRHGEGLFNAELARLEGEWVLASMPADERAAASLFESAIAIARQQQARLFELRARASLAKLAVRGSARADAVQEMAMLLASFPPDDDSADVAAVRAFLASLPPSGEAAVTTAAGKSIAEHRTGAA